MINRRIEIIITGVVQGVWFRKSALEEAQKLGLTGWVRNAANGSVIAQAEGPANKVEQFVTWCYRGSENAVVTGVETKNIPLLNDEERDFSILR